MAKNKVKVPKTVGGWKLSKGLRKSGVVNTLLNNDLGRNILADVLIAAARAAAAALVQDRPSIGRRSLTPARQHSIRVSEPC